MIPEDLTPTQASTAPHCDGGTTPAEAAPCPRCGVTATPVLSQGSGPHAIRASCGHCHRFLRWISVLAPSERLAHRLKARLEAMRQHPASAAQLALLMALGDAGPPPGDMAQASVRIEELKAGQEARNSKAQGQAPKG